jgi:hypothetical protein
MADVLLGVMNARKLRGQNHEEQRVEVIQCNGGVDGGAISFQHRQTSHDAKDAPAARIPDSFGAIYNPSV